jgi:c-di-AMP phosphodiesterase-like protein
MIGYDRIPLYEYVIMASTLFSYSRIFKLKDKMDEELSALYSQVKEEQNALTSILELSPVGVIIVDNKTSAINFMNESFKVMFEKDPMSSFEDFT